MRHPSEVQTMDDGGRSSIGEPELNRSSFRKQPMRHTGGLLDSNSNNNSRPPVVVLPWSPTMCNGLDSVDETYSSTEMLSSGSGSLEGGFESQQPQLDTMEPGRRVAHTLSADIIDAIEEEISRAVEQKMEEFRASFGEFIQDMQQDLETRMSSLEARITALEETACEPGVIQAINTNIANLSSNLNMLRAQVRSLQSTGGTQCQGVSNISGSKRRRTCEPASATAGDVEEEGPGSVAAQTQMPPPSANGVVASAKSYGLGLRALLQNNNAGKLSVKQARSQSDHAVERTRMVVAAPATAHNNSKTAAGVQTDVSGGLIGQVQSAQNEVLAGLLKFRKPPEEENNLVAMEEPDILLPNAQPATLDCPMQAGTAYPPPAKPRLARSKRPGRANIRHMRAALASPEEIWQTMRDAMEARLRPPNAIELSRLCEQLEKFFQPDAKEYKRESLDRWREWNARIYFFWEKTDEDHDPYALMGRIKEWLQTNFDYDPAPIIGAWRSPICREKWTAKGDRKDEVKNGEYVHCRQIILKFNCLEKALLFLMEVGPQIMRKHRRLLVDLDHNYRQWRTRASIFSAPFVRPPVVGPPSLDGSPDPPAGSSSSLVGPSLLPF